MDITTGHVILAYIEEHLNDKNRLTKEWQDLCDYEADSIKTEAASLPQNLTKNRYSNILACKFNYLSQIVLKYISFLTTCLI